MEKIKTYLTNGKAFLASFSYLEILIGLLVVKEVVRDLSVPGCLCCIAFVSSLSYKAYLKSKEQPPISTSIKNDLQRLSDTVSAIKATQSLNSKINEPTKRFF